MPTNVSPIRPTLAFDGNDRNWKLLISVVAPNDPTAIRWVIENADILNGSVSVLDGIQWEDAVLGGEDPSSKYHRHHQRYAIYTIHREIARKATSLDAQKSAHALLSKIVWFRWDPEPDEALEFTHLREVRCALRLLLQEANDLPKVNELEQGKDWLDDPIRNNLKEDRYLLKRLQAFLNGEVLIGTRKRSAPKRQPQKDLSDRLWKQSAESPRIDKASFPKEEKLAEPRELTSSARKLLSGDDGKATDRLTIDESRRSGGDARVHVNYMEDVRLMASVKGYDRFETYTDQVAGLLLSKLSPDSPSGVLAFLAIVLGRNLTRLKAGSANGCNGVFLPSTQDPTKSLSLKFPFNTELLVANWKSADKQFTKLTQQVSGTLGSRLSLGGLSRFGVMRFHGLIGIVQSEQLQGRTSVGSVTALYARISDADFQRALNQVLEATLLWVGQSAPYVGENWKTWAGLMLERLAPVPDATQFYGSTRNEWLDQEAIKQAKYVLRGALGLYREALDVASRKAAYADYLKLSAQELQASFMALTGGRPITMLTRMSLLDGFVSVADKQCYGELEARMVAVPQEWLVSVNRHLTNIVKAGEALDLRLNVDIKELRHPFVYIKMDAQQRPTLSHLEQRDVTTWLAAISRNANFVGNGMRHSAVSGMIAGGAPDGQLAQQVGHDRGFSGVSSKHRSIPALLPPVVGLSDWVPKVEVLQ